MDGAVWPEKLVLSMGCLILYSTWKTPGQPTEGKNIVSVQLLATWKHSYSILLEIVSSICIPMRVWQMAGLCSESVRQATIVSCMLLGVYFTR